MSGQLNKNNINSKVIRLAIPIMLQALLVNGVTFVDTLMIGQLGEVAIAAIGVASQLFFLITMFLYGIASGSSIFISQFWGAQDKDGISKVISISIIFTIVSISAISIYSTLNPTSLMLFFSKDKEIIKCGNTYLQVVGFSYVLTGLSFIYATGLRSINDTKTPLILSIIALSLDVIGNYVLIFGIGIFPELGVLGGAISTSFSRFVELLLYIIITNKRKDCPIRFSFNSLKSIERKFAIKMLKTTAPVIFNNIFWSIGMISYKVAFSKIGTDALAAVQIVESINNLFLVLIQGYAGSIAIVIGNMIGANQEEDVKKYSKTIILYSGITGIVAAILLYISSSLFVSLFNVNDEVYKLSMNALVSLSIMLPIKFLNISTIVGLLRAGGDTKYTMVLELTSIWIVGVPLTFIGVLFWHLPLQIVYLFTGAEEAVKLIAELLRVKSGKYIHNLVRKN